MTRARRAGTLMSTMFRIRALQRTLAWVALAACLGSVVLPGLEAHPAGAADDAACRLVVGHDGHSLPGIAAPESSVQGPDHCVVCHLQRALRGAFVSDVATLTSPIEAESFARLTWSFPSAGALAAPTSRGPPTFHTS